MKTFLITVKLGDKFDCHVVVGTLKEVVSCKIMRNYNIEKVTLCVFDDADAIVTINLIKMHIIGNLTQCRKILMSSRIRTNIDFMKPYTIQVDASPIKVKQCFANCNDDYEKLLAVLAVHEFLTSLNAQGIIFFEVRAILSIVYL